MADYPSYGWLELNVTLGQILNSVAAAGAAWWVGRVIQRRNADERATKDLIVGLTKEALDTLSSLHDALDTHCPTAGAIVEEPVKHKLMRGLRIFSNSIYTIETALMQCSPKPQDSTVDELKATRENLREQISEPLVTPGSFDDSQLRQIEKGILKGRQSLIKFQLSIHKNTIKLR